MSSSWRTVASPKAVAASSGTSWPTRAFSSSLPSAISVAAMVPKKDLVTDIAMCGVSGLSTPK